jgi:hypothetical protein
LILAMLACALPIPGVGAQPTTIAAMWPDVPVMDGMTKSDLEVPVFVHILLTAVTKQVLGDGQDSGDWINYTTTKTPADVQAFYTPQLMAANGWDASDKSTCLTGTDQGVPQVGVFCVFQKTLTGKTDGLMIIATQDDKTKLTNVFFVRVQTVARTPTPGK